MITKYTEYAPLLITNIYSPFWAENRWRVRSINSFKNKKRKQNKKKTNTSLSKANLLRI